MRGQIIDTATNVARIPYDILDLTILNPPVHGPFKDPWKNAQVNYGIGSVETVLDIAKIPVDLARAAGRLVGAFAGEQPTAFDYAEAYQVATGATACLAGGAPIGNRIAFGNPANRVFWSGPRADRAAAKFANNNGGTTLEMTLVGKALDSVTTRENFPRLAPFWAAASRSFARNAEGPVNVFHSKAGVRLKSVWTKEEYPILKDKGTEMKFHMVD